MSSAAEAVLELRGLRVELDTGERVVDEVDLELRRGEILGVVGESGSGKTTTALALLGFARSGVRIAGGALRLGRRDVDLASEKDVRRLRGQTISYVAQDPGSALDPSLRVESALKEMLRTHHAVEPGAEIGALTAVLESVGLPSTPPFRRRFPHQLSGGQQQRVCAAVALSCTPSVVVLDEPTTGLDVVTQADFLRELTRLRDRFGLSMVYVTHDLAVLSEIADEIAVMYAGRIVESGPAAEILSHPVHPYSRALIECSPDHVELRRLRPLEGAVIGVGEWPPGCPFAPRCELAIDACTAAMPAVSTPSPGRTVRCLRSREVGEPKIERVAGWERGETERVPLLEVDGLWAAHLTPTEEVIAAAGVSLTVRAGECVALVGESGSGKTTIARTIAGLHPPAAGMIKLAGTPLSYPARRRKREQRRSIQIVFQDPMDALNPVHTIRDAVARPAIVLRGLSTKDATVEAMTLLERVRLPRRLADRFPADLSGGERQRVGIARALAAAPQVIVCDEITSALDVSVQSGVLSMLDDLRRDLSLSLLFITHDLGVVATIADYVLVLQNGRVCEEGPTEKVLRRPDSPYTIELMSAAPSISSASGPTDVLDADSRNALL